MSAKAPSAFTTFGSTSSSIATPGHDFILAGVKAIGCNNHPTTGRHRVRRDSLPPPEFPVDQNGGRQGRQNTHRLKFEAVSWWSAKRVLPAAPPSWPASIPVDRWQASRKPREGRASDANAAVLVASFMPNPIAPPRQRPASRRIWRGSYLLVKYCVTKTTMRGVSPYQVAQKATHVGGTDRRPISASGESSS